MQPTELADRVRSAAFAFRGYNVTNLGRSRDLLQHAAYGSVVARWLKDASAVCADTVHQPVDLIARVERGEEATLATYHESIALIVAMELAQLELLEQFFGIRYADAAMAYGYSLGELTAVVAGGVIDMASALRIPLTVAADCAELAADCTMGVLFSRGPVLSLEQVDRLCVQITAEGQGIVAISSQLAPNAVLLLGQRGTIDRFSELMHAAFPDRVYLRKNTDRWPPLHTPLVWERNIPNRCGVLMHAMRGGLVAPQPPVLSLVTGKLSYNDYNARQLLYRWIDHPQKLWDAVYETLASGIETVIHVGPDPNLIPATFQRLTDNVKSQLSGRSWGSFGLRAMSRAVRRPWLSAVLPSRSALLRAPLIEHVILEDWLLAQPVTARSAEAAASA